MEDRRHHDEFPPNSRIFIGNLDPSVYEEDIKSTFKRYGRIGENRYEKEFCFCSARNSKHERKEDVPFHSQNKRSRHENPRRRQNSGGGPPTRWGDNKVNLKWVIMGIIIMEIWVEESGGGPYGDRNVAAYDQFSQSIQPGPSFRQNDTNPYEGAPCSSGIGNQQERRTNDVEIVCSNRSIIEYAESIENRLIILGSITNRGVRYAMLITPMSRENRSVTLNANYEGNMPKSHPREIMTLLELLIQNKTLALSDYDDLIRYLFKETFKQSRATTMKKSSIFSIIKAMYLLVIMNPDQMIKMNPLQLILLCKKAIDSLIKTGPNLLNQIKKLEVPPREK
ncbi:unnamed protein product [Lepeophtheirus salmonis]|uniref:(salmon louse) hypothetical protein n=1 Tax=Lepeophtheirus salmonis TaxID=72036 RepID=A0A7R8H2L9_LEPSM|nr:unnamed protein product [Lepeophtheirus salmonis]CAF2828721.1 unnamed protein product [Lepeophtheirus salmonis]